MGVSTVAGAMQFTRIAVAVAGHRLGHGMECPLVPDSGHGRVADESRRVEDMFTCCRRLGRSSAGGRLLAPSRRPSDSRPAPLHHWWTLGRCRRLHRRVLTRISSSVCRDGRPPMRCTGLFLRDIRRDENGLTTAAWSVPPSAAPFRLQSTTPRAPLRPRSGWRVTANPNRRGDQSTLLPVSQDLLAPGRLPKGAIRHRACPVVQRLLHYVPE